MFFFCSRCGHTNHPPTPDMKGDNRRQWETTGAKTTSEPKKQTTPTNTKEARSKVALRTPTVNCLGNNVYIFSMSLALWQALLLVVSTNGSHSYPSKNQPSLGKTFGLFWREVSLWRHNCDLSSMLRGLTNFENPLHNAKTLHLSRQLGYPQ